MNIRPVNSVNVNMNYFMPGTLGGDHAFKIGGYWKDANSYGSTHTPGLRGRALPDRPSATTARWRPPNCQAQVTRDGQTDYDLLNISALRAGHLHARPR